jgi:hypothetical protein
MASYGWQNEQIVHDWGSYYSRFVGNVFINGINRNDGNVNVYGTVLLACHSNGTSVWYNNAVNVWVNGAGLGQIKPRTTSHQIKNWSWTRGFNVTIGCSNDATSVTFPVRYLDSQNSAWTHETIYFTIYFNQYSRGPQNANVSATLNSYSSVTTNVSGIDWGSGYNYTQTTCVASYTDNGQFYSFTLGNWSNNATSFSATKTDFVFYTNTNLTLTWTMQTNLGKIVRSTQVYCNATNPIPSLDNATITAENTGVYKFTTSISGVDYSYNYTSASLVCSISYTLDNVQYSYIASADYDHTPITGSATINGLELSPEAPWTKVPDDGYITITWTATNSNGSTSKSTQLYCQPSYEAYVIDDTGTKKADLFVSAKEGSQTYSNIRRITKL